MNWTHQSLCTHACGDRQSRKWQHKALLTMVSCVLRTDRTAVSSYLLKLQVCSMLQQTPASTTHSPLSCSPALTTSTIYSCVRLRLVHSSRSTPQGSWPELTGREHLIQDTVLFLWRASMQRMQSHAQLFSSHSLKAAAVSVYSLSSLMHNEIWATWNFTYKAHYFLFWFLLTWHLEIKSHS